MYHVYVWYRVHNTIIYDVTVSNRVNLVDPGLEAGPGGGEQASRGQRCS